MSCQDDRSPPATPSVLHSPPALSPHSSLARSPSNLSQRSCDIVLPYRNQRVADKPNVRGSWTSDEYAASLSAAADRASERFYEAATGARPYAIDVNGIHAAAGGSAHSSRQPTPRHTEAVPAKPNNNVIGNDVYARSLESAASRRQQRFAAATGAPFALDDVVAGTAREDTPRGTAYQLRKPSSSHMEQSTKPNEQAWDQNLFEEQCRARAAAQAAARQRNWGTIGLLG